MKPLQVTKWFRERFSAEEVVSSGAVGLMAPEQRLEWQNANQRLRAPLDWRVRPNLGDHGALYLTTKIGDRIRMPPGPWIAFIGHGWLFEEGQWMSRFSGCIPTELTVELLPLTYWYQERQIEMDLKLVPPMFRESELQATASLHCSISGPWRQLWDDTRRWVETFPNTKVSWREILADTDGWAVPKVHASEERL